MKRFKENPKIEQIKNRQKNNFQSLMKEILNNYKIKLKKKATNINKSSQREDRVSDDKLEV